MLLILFFTQLSENYVRFTSLSVLTSQQDSEVQKEKKIFEYIVRIFWIECERNWKIIHLKNNRGSYTLKSQS